MSILRPDVTPSPPDGVAATNAPRLSCDLCGRSIEEGEHHGHGFEVVCEVCYGNRFDQHADFVAAAVLDDLIAALGAESFPFAEDPLRDLRVRFADDYAEEIIREATRRVSLRLHR